VVSRARLLSFVPWVFALHSVEEGAAISRALPRLHAQLPAAAREWTAAALSPARFQLVLAVITAAMFVLTFSGPLDARGARRGYVLLVIVATLLLNVASHTITAVMSRSYVPGLVTALAINLPFCASVLHRAWHDRWYRRRTLALLAPLAVLVHGPALIAVVRFAA
jgi:hypothetical protein